MAYGELNKNGDEYSGFLADITYDTELTLKIAAKPQNPDPEKSYPDWSIFATTPSGRVIPAGAGWDKVSKAKKPFISLKLSMGGEPLYLNAVQNSQVGADLTIMEMGK